jgi:hypothetical protein
MILINPQDGSLSCGIGSVSPNVSHNYFLSSPFGMASDLVCSNQEWRTYRLKLSEGTDELCLTFLFHGQSLRQTCFGYINSSRVSPQKNKVLLQQVFARSKLPLNSRFSWGWGEISLDPHNGDYYAALHWGQASDSVQLSGKT